MQSDVRRYFLCFNFEEEWELPPVHALTVFKVQTGALVEYFAERNKKFADLGY